MQCPAHHLRPWRNLEFTTEFGFSSHLVRGSYFTTSAAVAKAHPTVCILRSSLVWRYLSHPNSHLCLPPIANLLCWTLLLAVESYSFDKADDYSAIMLHWHHWLTFFSFQLHFKHVAQTLLKISILGWKQSVSRYNSSLNLHLCFYDWLLLL